MAVAIERIQRTPKALVPPDGPLADTAGCAASPAALGQECGVALVCVYHSQHPAKCFAPVTSFSTRRHPVR